MSSSRRSSKQSDASGELIYECKAAFLSIYDDINDKIESKKRLSNVLQQSGRNPTRTSLDKYWPRNTEELSFNDFVDICRKEPVTSADDLMKAFKKIDINGDGYISLDELYKIMNAHGEMMSREEVRKMIDEVDENKDGKLDYQETYSSKRPVMWRDKIFYDQYTNMIMKTAEESKKFSRKVMEKKERKKKRGEKHNSASNMDSEKLSGQTKSLDHNSENLRENIAEKFEDSVHDKPKSDEHVGNLSEDLKKGETRSDSELRGFGSETKGDNNFGSVTSLRSTRKKDRLLGSVTSLRSDSKKNNAGSQVSIRTLQDEQTGSKVALRSSDDTGSKVSLGSKTGDTGSQISLKLTQGSRSSLRLVQKESMGSKSSLTSYKEKEKTTDVKGADTSKHEPDAPSHKSHYNDDDTSESPKKDSPKASPRSRSDSGGKNGLKKGTPREHAQKDSGTKETPRREHLTKHDKPPLPDSPKTKDSIADKTKAYKHEKVETPKTAGSKDSARTVGEEIDYDDDFDIVSTGRPTPRIDLSAAPAETPRKEDKHAKEGTKDKEKSKSDEKKEKDTKESARSVKGNTSNRSVDSNALASTAKKDKKTEEVTSPERQDRKKIEDGGDKKSNGIENKKTLNDDKIEKSDVPNKAVRTIKKTGEIENVLKASKHNENHKGKEGRTTEDEKLMSSSRSNKTEESLKATHLDLVDEIFKSSRNSRSLLAREFQTISHDSTAEEQPKQKGDTEENSKDSKSHKGQESTPKAPPRKDKKDAKIPARNENGLGSQASLRSGISGLRFEKEQPTVKSLVRRHGSAGWLGSLPVAKAFQYQFQYSKGDKEISAPVPSPRKSVSRLSEDDVPRPSPRVKGGVKGKSPSTKGRDKLPDPKSLQDWMYYTSKGCFFYEEDEIVSHVYSLKLTQDSTVYLSAYPIQEPASLNLSGAEPVDTALFIFDSRGKFVTCTEHRDTKGTYGVKCDLGAGEYQVLPYTTGCRFKQRSEDSQENMKESKLVKVKDDKVSITSAFRTALEEIFDLCDLDNNGLMSRDEFNWFNLRTSGEELGEDEWEVVEEKTKLSHGEITKQGFIELNEMEAEDAQGDVEDLWITLTSMGMNKGLIMDEACPYRVDVYVEESGRKKPSFRVTGIESLEKKEFVSEICHFTIEKADEPTKVRNMKDLYMYTYRNEYRATIVIDNRSRSSVNLQANCSRSKNVVSNRPALDHTVEVEPQSMAIAHHLLPKSELSDWTVSCTENILK